MAIDKDVLTTGEVAKICQVAPRTVSKWFDSGHLKGYRIPGSKDRRIPVSELVRFMRAHNIPLDGLSTGQTRVLIVDDDAEVVDTLRKVLSEQTNYEVHTADTAFAAGLICERARPHVLLMDIHLGGEDASAVAKLVRSSESLSLTRIIAMSGKLTDGQAASVRAQGFDGFLKKPFVIRQLVESIEKATNLAA